MKQKSGSKKIEKGDYGYLAKGKQLQLIIAFVLMVGVGIIFYTGYIKYHNTKNIFTVFAVVGVIPMARFLVTYIVMMPYKTLDHELYQEISAFQNVLLAYDLLISSSEKITDVKIAAIRDNSVYMYVPNKKYKGAEVEKYVRSFLEKECKITSVKMISGFDKYKEAVKRLDNNEAGKYDKRIRELMIVFSV